MTIKKEGINLVKNINKIARSRTNPTDYDKNYDDLKHSDLMTEDLERIARITGFFLKAVSMEDGGLV